MGLRDGELKRLAEEYKKRADEAFEEKDFAKAIRYVQDAINLFKICGEDDSYARSLNFLGVVYATMGAEATAVDYYLEGLGCAREKKLFGIIPMFYNNIGSRYQELGEHKRAIFYFEKAIEIYQREEARKEKYYWDKYCIYLVNLAISWHALGNLEKTAWYLEESSQVLEKSEGKAEEFRLSMLIIQCSIRWDLGDGQFIQEKLHELLELSKDTHAVGDYMQDVQELALLLKRTGNHKSWQKLLATVEEVTNNQKLVHYQIVAVEMWMDYYQTVEEPEKYQELCIKYVQLSQEQKKIENRERVQALDIRIVLKEKEEQRKIAEVKAETDTLTSLGNRYALERESKVLIHEAIRDGRMLAVGILDIDCFKQMNDTYGHNVGDECLWKVGTILRNTVEGYGSVYRFGGDEFVILIPDGDEEAVERIAERIKRKVAAAAIVNENSAISDHLTVSQGYACFSLRQSHRLVRLLECADKALYEVKDNGRNGYRIITEDME